MPLTVNTNTLSLNAQRHLGNNTTALGKSLEKLSSGFRINRAGDDAAGLGLSENLRAQIRGSKQALNNVQDGLGMLAMADGALQQVTDNVQRMRELYVQRANGTYGATQQAAIDAEVAQLNAENTRITTTTQYTNGVNLFGAAVTLQIGANTADTFAITTALAAPAAVGTVSSIATADTALNNVNTTRGNIGAFTNRLEGTANNLSIAVENLSGSESRIRNVDVAAESANLVRNQILQQASAAMLSQANQVPGLALSLLG